MPTHGGIKRRKHASRDSRMEENVSIMIFVMKTYLRPSQEHPRPSTTKQPARTLKVRKANPQQTASYGGAPDENLLVHVGSHAAKTCPFEFLGARCTVWHSGPVLLTPPKQT